MSNISAAVIVHQTVLLLIELRSSRIFTFNESPWFVIID